MNEKAPENPEVDVHASAEASALRATEYTTRKIVIQSPSELL